MKKGEYQSVSKYAVFQEYMRRSKSFLNMGNLVDNDDNEFWNAAFLYSISLELGCKSFLLYHEGKKFENLPFVEQKEAINKLSRNKSHGLVAMLQQMQKISCHQGIRGLLEKQYRNQSGCILTGGSLAEILESCYGEIRYPMPQSIIEKFPIAGEIDSFYAVTRDVYLRYFVEEVLQEIQIEIDYKQKQEARKLSINRISPER